MIKWLLCKRDVRRFNHENLLRETRPVYSVLFALREAVPEYERQMRSGIAPYMCRALGRLRALHGYTGGVDMTARMAKRYIDNMLEDRATLRSWLRSRRYRHTTQDCHQWWTDHINAMEAWLNDPKEH